MNCRHRPPKQGTPHHHNVGITEEERERTSQDSERPEGATPCNCPVELPTPTPRQCKPLWSLELESFLVPWLKDLSKDRLPGSPSSKISLGAKVSPSSLLIWPG